MARDRLQAARRRPCLYEGRSPSPEHREGPPVCCVYEKDAAAYLKKMNPPIENSSDQDPKKRQSRSIGMWMGFGVAIGIAIGAALGNPAYGVGIGVALGAGI